MVASDSAYNYKSSENFYRIRIGFVRKVYTILLFQVLSTFAAAGLFIYFQIHLFVSSWILFSCTLLTFVVLFALAALRHHVPLNYALLVLFTLLESLTVGIAISFYELCTVIMALIVTFSIFGSLILLASLLASNSSVTNDESSSGKAIEFEGSGLQSCALISALFHCRSIRNSTLSVSAGDVVFDAENPHPLVSLEDHEPLATSGATWATLIFAFLDVLIVAILIQFVWPSEAYQAIVAALGVLVFGALIVLDARRLAYQLSAEEYVLAAVELYLDLLNLYLFIARLSDAAVRACR